MSLINSGFDGTVTERDFSRIMRGVGVRDSVETVAAWEVTQGTGRQVSVAPGVAYAAGVVSDSGLAILAALPTPVNGQWHLVVRRITWANNTVTVATIPHTTTTTTIPTAPPAGFPVFNDNTGVLVDQHLAWAWVRSTDTAVAVFDLRNVQGVQRTSVVVADFTALALLPAGVRFVGEQAFVVEGAVYMSWTGTAWRQTTTATFATTGARDTAYAKASAAFRVVRVRALDTSTGVESAWNGSAWVLEDTGWITMALIDGWSHSAAPFGPARYRLKDKILYLQGRCQGGNIGGGRALANLPAGFRPTLQLLIPAATAPNALAVLEINENGNLIQVGGFSATWFSFSGISYPVVN